METTATMQPVSALKVTPTQATKGDVRTREFMLDYLDNAVVGLHWVDGEGTIIWANKADYEPLGYSEDEYLGHNITEFHADAAVINDILERLDCSVGSRSTTIGRGWYARTGRSRRSSLLPAASSTARRSSCTRAASPSTIPAEPRRRADRAQQAGQLVRPLSRCRRS